MIQKPRIYHISHGLRLPYYATKVHAPAPWSTLDTVPGHILRTCTTATFLKAAYACVGPPQRAPAALACVYVRDVKTRPVQCMPRLYIITGDLHRTL